MRHRLARVVPAAALIGWIGCAPQGAPLEGLGWIEFALADADIPMDPRGDSPRPTCRIVLSLDGELLLDEELEPWGAAAPYRLEKSFRFPAAAGRHLARVSYIGCRFVGDRVDALEAEMEVPVVAGFTTRLHFDGPVLRWEGFFPTRSL